MTTVDTTLEGIQKFMEGEGLAAEVQEYKELDARQLLVQLGPELQLQIRFLHEDSDGLFRPLQIVVPMPYTAKKELSGDIARFILMINKTVDLPGFDYHEPDGVLFYRVVHLCDKKGVSEEVLKTLLGAFLTIYDTFGELLQAVASGEKSIEAVLKELISDER